MNRSVGWEACPIGMVWVHLGTAYSNRILRNAWYSTYTPLILWAMCQTVGQLLHRFKTTAVMHYSWLSCAPPTLSLVQLVTGWNQWSDDVIACVGEGGRAWARFWVHYTSSKNRASYLQVNSHVRGFTWTRSTWPRWPLDCISGGNRYSLINIICDFPW